MNLEWSSIAAAW